MMRSTQSRGRLLVAATLMLVSCQAALQAQQYGPPPADNDPVMFRVERSSQRMEMIINTSRILTHPNPVPRVLVNNPEIVSATPLSPNQIQLSARRTGVTQVNLWDKNDNVFTVDVIVTADARELEELIRTEFPQAEVRVRPLANSVVLTGYVPSPDMIGRIVRMSEDYYSNVINNMSVGGVQQVMLHVKIVEVSRSKMRQLGVDWTAVNGQSFITSSVSGMAPAISFPNAGDPLTGGAVTGAGNVSFGVVNDNNALFGFLNALRENRLAKIMAEPTLVTVSGRPASFNSGGEFPIQIAQSLGTNSVQYKEFGTRVDFVPIVLGNGKIRLEVRPQITERDDANGIAGQPALTSRWVDTAVEMKAGQTLALAGLMQTRISNVNRGIPVLSDLPWVGAAFRNVQQQYNEIELLIIVRPEFVEPVYPHEAPQCYPGQFTKAPNQHDFYGRGYMEVPKCCNDGTCPSCLGGEGTVIYEDSPSYQNSPATPAQPLPAPNQPTPNQPTPNEGASHMNGPGNYPYGASSQAVRPAAVHVAPQYQQSVGAGAANPPNRQNPAPITSSAQQSNHSNDPQLLGPMGYDVLDFNN